jgi:hypothetical protein
MSLNLIKRGRRGFNAPVNAVAAVLATALAGANNDLTFTARIKGAAGNSITISYVDPGEETEAESVAVTGTAIVVTLRNRSSTLSTAAQVKTAIEASAAAAALITVANKGADTGAGNVIALVATALAGGVDGTPGKPWDTMYYNGYLYFCASDAGNLISGGNWYKVQLTVVS